MSFSFYCYVCDKEYHRERDYRTHKDTKGHISCYNKIWSDRCNIAKRIRFIADAQDHQITPILKEKAGALTDILVDEKDLNLHKFRNNVIADVYDPVAEERNRTNARKIQADIAAFCEKYAVPKFKYELVLPSVIEMIDSGIGR
jgi:hypothetical protein